MLDPKVLLPRPHLRPIKSASAGGVPRNHLTSMPHKGENEASLITLLKLECAQNSPGCPVKMQTLKTLKLKKELYFVSSKT